MYEDLTSDIRFDIFSPVFPSCKKHQISGIKYSPSVQCLYNFYGIGITMDNKETGLGRFIIHGITRLYLDNPLESIVCDVLSRCASFIHVSTLFLVPPG